MSVLHETSYADGGSVCDEETLSSAPHLALLYRLRVSGEPLRGRLVYAASLKNCRRSAGCQTGLSFLATRSVLSDSLSHGGQMRWIPIALLGVHGLIHLMGFAKAFGYADLPQLTQPISRAWGVVWLVAACLVT